jgi:hypothetical protein
MKGKKTDCNNCGSSQILSAMFKFVSKIILSKRLEMKRKLFRIISVQLDLMHSKSHFISCNFRVLEKIDIKWKSASDVYRLQQRI